MYHLALPSFVNMSPARCVEVAFPPSALGMCSPYSGAGGSRDMRHNGLYNVLSGGHVTLDLLTIGECFSMQYRAPKDVTIHYGRGGVGRGGKGGGMETCNPVLDTSVFL